MKTEINFLDHVEIAAPCHADWDKMEGDDRARHCQDCRLNVYNLSDMSQKEAEALVRKNEGSRLCVRFYRRNDGTIITDNCPAGVRRLRNLAIAKCAALASAVSAMLYFPISKAMSFVGVEDSPRISKRISAFQGDTFTPFIPPTPVNPPTAGMIGIQPVPQTNSVRQGAQGKIAGKPATARIMGEIHTHAIPTSGKAQIRREFKGETGEVSSSKKR